jgi:hypothetical protein
VTVAAALWVRKRWDARRVREYDERAARLEERYGRPFASGLEARAVCMLVAKHGRTDAARALGVSPNAVTQFACQHWTQRVRVFGFIRERLATVMREGWPL